MNDFKAKKTVIPVHPLRLPLIAGFLLGGAVCFVILIIAAFLMTIKDLPEWSLGLITLFAAASGSLAGGIISSKIYKKRGIFIGAAIGLIIFVTIFIIGCCCGAEVFSLMRLASLLADAVFGAVGWVIGVNSVSKRKF